MIERERETAMEIRWYELNIASYFLAVITDDECDWIGNELKKNRGNAELFRNYFADVIFLFNPQIFFYRWKWATQRANVYIERERGIIFQLKFDDSVNYEQRKFIAENDWPA